MKLKLRHIPLIAVTGAINLGLQVVCVAGIWVYIGYKHYASNRK